MKPLTPEEARALLAEKGRTEGVWSGAGSSQKVRPAFADEQVQALLALRTVLGQQLAEMEGKKAEALQKLALLRHGGGS